MWIIHSNIFTSLSLVNVRRLVTAADKKPLHQVEGRSRGAEVAPVTVGEDEDSV